MDKLLRMPVQTHLLSDPEPGGYKNLRLMHVSVHGTAATFLADNHRPR